LHVYEGNTESWNCNVVVGSDSTNTVVFNDSLESIVFSPAWEIPKSIVLKETVPSMMKNSDYLANHNMEITDKDGNVIDPNDIKWKKIEGDFPYHIRQVPGPDNALGKVKFLLPNSHSIYLHDTPAKSLFEENERAFSHGCIRVSEPVKLAKFLLRDQTQWTSDSISLAMNGEKETYVKLKKKVPVFISYFTAWVNEKKELQFRDDIYGLDARMIYKENQTALK
jgi:L,D-transpeptidase YcbB